MFAANSHERSSIQYVMSLFLQPHGDGAERGSFCLQTGLTLPAGSARLKRAHPRRCISPSHSSPVWMHQPHRAAR